MSKAAVVTTLVMDNLPIIIGASCSPIVTLLRGMRTIALHAPDSRKIRGGVSVLNGKSKIGNTVGGGPKSGLTRFAAELSAADMDCFAEYKLPSL